MKSGSFKLKYSGPNATGEEYERQLF